MEIVIKITESDVQEALEQYGYEVTPQRITSIMEAIATSRCADTFEILNDAIETLADEQNWQTA